MSQRRKYPVQDPNQLGVPTYQPTNINAQTQVEQSLYQNNPVPQQQTSPFGQPSISSGSISSPNQIGQTPISYGSNISTPSLQGSLSQLPPASYGSNMPPSTSYGSNLPSSTSYGSNLPPNQIGGNAQPPTSSSQMQAQKSKRVYPGFDPETQTYDSGVNQLTSGINQLNVTGMGPAQQSPVQQSPIQPTPSQQPYPQQSTSPVMVPTPGKPQLVQQEFQPVVNPSLQCPLLYMRPSINVVPNSTSLMDKSSIPFGCIIHPMAKSTSKEDRIPVVNFGASGIIRCRRCRAYINPFVVFCDNGRRWRCNLCGLPNDVPSDYYCQLDAAGRRTDVNERPELSKGCVEFVAPAEYMVRPPMPPTYFFVIDAGYYAISTGMFYTTVQSIKSLLKSFPGSSRVRIGFITYDSSLHFYNLRSNLSNPQMYVVTDINEVFLPIPDYLLVNLYDSREIINKFLDKLLTIHQSTQNIDSALGTAIQAAQEIIKNIGGKILIFASTLPNVGAAKLTNRENLKLLGTDKEVSLLLPEENFYKEFALDCSRLQISFDLFLFSSSFIDVPTLGCLAQYTGGQVLYYPGFKSDRDGEKLYRDIHRVITRETGWEAVMRVRASKGIKVLNHYGNFFIRSTDLLALPAVDADKAFGIQLGLSDSVLGSQHVSIQCALLYTTSFGERRIRSLTQCYTVSSSLADLFRFADVEGLTTLTTKIAIEKCLSGRLSDTREALVNKCIEILSVYRQNIASGASTQLMLPDSLKLFPLYILSLVKNILFRSGTDVRPDERSAYMMLLRTLSVSSTILFLYPRLFPLHNLSSEVGTKGENEKIILPPTIHLSSEKLESSGIYLLENGQEMYIWVGKNVSPTLMSDIFGVTSLDTVDTQGLFLPTLENETSQKIHAIIQYVRESHPTFQPLRIIKAGEPRESKFLNSYFVEDRTKSVHSYYEFLVNLHQRVQAKLQK